MAKELKDHTVMELRKMAKKHKIKQVKRDGTFKTKSELIRNLKAKK
jgi:hypothetical protein